MKRRYRPDRPHNPPDNEPIFLPPEEYVRKANTVSITECQQVALDALTLSVQQQQHLENLANELGIEEELLSREKLLSRLVLSSRRDEYIQ